MHISVRHLFVIIVFREVLELYMRLNLRTLLHCLEAAVPGAYVPLLRA